MKVTQAIKSYKEYHSINSKKNRVKNYEIQNPCDTQILRKIFKDQRPQQWKIIEEDLVALPRKI